MVVGIVENRDAFTNAQQLQDMLVQQATDGGAEDSDYIALRSQFMRDPVLKSRLPEFVIKSRNLSQFWHFIKLKFGTYKERRVFIWDSFRPLLDFLEGDAHAPHDDVVSRVIGRVSSDFVASAWQKSLERRVDDPEGAITSARTLLESVCKYILDQETAGYSETDDLPKLYRLTAQSLNLAPDQHTEELFKQILGGCITVVNGLGSLRNKLSDSHGRASTSHRPNSRHAQLAVNLAGAIATFLIETYEAKVQ